MGNGITKILPDLYLGNLKDARDRELLARHNITHILSIHDTASPVLEVRRLLLGHLRLTLMTSDILPAVKSTTFFEPRIFLEMTYLCIPAADHSKQNLIQFFKESIEFIHESRLKGEGCLVHCVAGVSRSVTLVVAYIMTVTGRGWVQALGAVRAARPCAGPNLGFLRQLEEFQNTELAQYRVWWTERFGKSPFSDDDEIQNLLNHKSANGRSETDAATAADLGTAGT